MSIAIKSANKRAIAQLATKLGQDPVGPSFEETLFSKGQDGRIRSLMTKNPEISPAKHSRKGRIGVADEMKLQLAKSYQPISRAVLIAVAIYFAFITVAHFFEEGTIGFLLLGSISGITSVLCFVMYRELRRRQLGYRELELRALGVFLLIYASLVAHHNLHLEPAKLVYFTFLTLVIATLSVSVRLVVFAVLVSLATTYWFAVRAGGEVMSQYAFVGLAGMLVSFCVAHLMRGAIKKEISARLLANELRDSAEAIADCDMITGLPNRRRFFREFRARMRAGDSNLRLALGIVGLDGFKPINDMFGHTVGDKMLLEVSRRLVKACGPECFVAHLGGDEFAILFDGFRRSKELEWIGASIRNEISQPYEIVGVKLAVSASVGFVNEHEELLTESELIERADYALNRAKRKKYGVMVYSRQHEMDRRQENAIAHNLRVCDREKEMYVVFQAQTDLATRKTIGFEALARWTNPELGNVRPDVFILAAERTGVIEELTPLLLRKALAAAKDWPSHLTLSFNLSISDIVSAAAMENICRVVAESGFPTNRLEFEVTETLIMTDYEQARISLQVLRKSGARVALDDFGVGYSNFQHIKELHINTVKIDRSFVKRLGDDRDSDTLMNAMVELCSTLGVESVIEGVETERQLAAVERAGGGCVQGYYFSKPMSADEIPVYLLKEQAGDLHNIEPESGIVV
jgi:diguanylate cyclase (GGDEF)-like protein